MPSIMPEIIPSILALGKADCAQRDARTEPPGYQGALRGARQQVIPGSTLGSTPSLGAYQHKRGRKRWIGLLE
jgi:hypothetical protein